jgi:hypothetical protein
MVIEEATEKYAEKYHLDHTDLGYLETYCKIIDDLASEFDASSLEACINEDDMTIAVSMECEDVTLFNADHAFYALAENSISVGFATTKNGNMLVKFVFPGVWHSC